MKLLLNQLQASDRVAIVTYAGSSGIALTPTPCSDKPKIVAAIEALCSGGSTNGASGIELAYKTARQNFSDGGINRVILATDGDFNVGVTDDNALVELIEREAKSGVFLSVLGFGMGNLKDHKLESLADKGNGHYAYIDTLQEAQKVLVDQLGGTLFTIAKDVKIQIEFNPGKVGAYRLIGYENRKLAAQDFNDDTKDAGEVGAGHSVTALYEIVPPGLEINVAGVDPLKYQTPETGNANLPIGEAPASEPAIVESDELMTVKLRYKQPDGDTSKKVEIPVNPPPIAGVGMDPSGDFKFAAAVAEFGMILRGSAYKGNANLDQVLDLARQGKGDDEDGYRAEFLQLVKLAQSLAE
jgi:Ca-activated chloride channel family protein